LNGRKYTVRICNIPGFCTSACVRIGGRAFESLDRPYGFTTAALDDVLASVRRVYADAAFA
jgi:hypothetical protein